MLPVTWERCGTLHRMLQLRRLTEAVWDHSCTVDHRLLPIKHLCVYPLCTASKCWKNHHFIYLCNQLPVVSSVERPQEGICLFKNSQSERPQALLLIYDTTLLSLNLQGATLANDKKVMLHKTNSLGTHGGYTGIVRDEFWSFSPFLMFVHFNSVCWVWVDSTLEREGLWSEAAQPCTPADKSKNQLIDFIQQLPLNPYYRGGAAVPRAVLR